MGEKSKIQLLGVYFVDEVPDVHLLELLIHMPTCAVDISSFTQKDDTLPKDSWQAAYDEHYLNEEGTKVIGTFVDHDILTETKTRVAFFMYDIDFDKTLSSLHGEIILSGPVRMPERLRKIISFEPVD